MENQSIQELFKCFGERDQYIQALKEFEKELENSSDRGLVLVSGSIIDELLGELLKAFLINSKSVEKDLFRVNGVLATFDAKIQMSYYLGLISINEKSNITYLQRVRNKFAHQFIDITFENDAISNVCRSFDIPKNCYMPNEIPRPNKETGELPKVDLNPIKRETSAKDRFIFTFKYLYLNLIARIFFTKLERREEYKKLITADEAILLQAQAFVDALKVNEDFTGELQDRLDTMKIEQKDAGTKDQDIQKEIQELELVIAEHTKDIERFEQFSNLILGELNYGHSVLKNSMKK
ncbi:transcriptional regulator [Bacillus sp. SH7-1]|uniref:MltR family transcriptional regulator n=1 Tax=Bacillus sp. SH7-1 TaxID=2217818 RepID=UPI0011CB2D86|nr:MltR family transcriptional regulator [Bacillus sp. SH7-1]TXR98725.1 transcriptional regulator [Bacillus sp. SH7-1]